MSSVVISGDTSGSVILQAPAVAGSTTVNLPANSMNMGNGGGNVSSNTAFGYIALNANTTGDANTAIGYNALKANTTGIQNVAVGYNSLFSGISTINNVALGDSALYSNTSGSNNTSVGRASLYYNTASNNSALGFGALFNNTTGTPNDAFGYQALYANTTGLQNVAIGHLALNSNTVGTTNTAVGSYAGLYNLSGSRNTYIGNEAGSNVTVSSTGNDNTTVGYRAGAGISTGSSNTIIGGNAGYNGTTNLTTGVNNVVIGQNSGTNGVGAQYQIVIGSGFNGQGDNYVSLGKAANYVYNQFTVNATWTRTSDERIKKDIQDDLLGLDFITKLRPVTYKWKPSNEVSAELHDHHTEENVMDLDAVMNGFIAQEVKSALDAVGNPVFGGWVTESDGAQAISREMFIMPLVNAVKELKAELDAVKAELVTLKGAA